MRSLVSTPCVEHLAERADHGARATQGKAAVGEFDSPTSVSSNLKCINNYLHIVIFIFNLIRLHFFKP